VISPLLASIYLHYVYDLWVQHWRRCLAQATWGMGIADPFNGHIDDFRISHIQRSDGWIATTWNNISNPGAFAVAGAEEEQGGESPPLTGAGVVVCLMG
jgi:hypothetical protein